MRTICTLAIALALTSSLAAAPNLRDGAYPAKFAGPPVVPVMVPANGFTITWAGPPLAYLGGDPSWSTYANGVPTVTFNGNPLNGTVPHAVPQSAPVVGTYVRLG